MTPSAFLRLLWGDVPPGQALIWRLPSKQSTWFRNWDNVDKFCAAHKADDIYTGVALISPKFALKEHTRTSNTNAAAIAGLWADIDIAGPLHKKAGLPEREDQVLKELDFEPPSLVIHSGHGLQVWWLFDKPWVFANAVEREQAQYVTRQWHYRLADVFDERGWVLDATHDLARIMRLPGTINHKGKPVPVMLISQSNTRLSRVLVLAQSARHAPQVPKLGAEVPFGESRPFGLESRLELAPVCRLDLQPDAMPPLARFEALAAISEKFMRSWLHQRRDMADQSASAYDMSLASIAVQAEWGDQEITNLLIAHRRERGEDLKLREDYYRRTINRARSNGLTGNL